MFAGIAGFRYGIEQATPNIKTVWANEFDKYASAVYRFRFGQGELIEQDIRTISTSSIPDIDILTGGFPCQSFSVAGKRMGFEDTRGTLFFEVARILADKRPRYFLLENVKGLVGHDFGKTLQTILGVLADLGYRDIQWCVVNSKCYVPQNRERIFIVGHLGERGRPEIFPLGETDGLHPGELGEDKVANCLDSSCAKGWLDKGQRTMVCLHTAFPGEVREYNDVAPTISTPSGGGHLPYVAVAFNKQVGVVSGIETALCLNSTDWRGLQRNQNQNAVSVGTQIRRLTPIECERLQGFPDDWTSIGLFDNIPKQISDTQRYRMAGNAVSTPVITAIVRKMAKVWF
jgi:DNA (cytosine-5)-methyltransferase 1